MKRKGIILAGGSGTRLYPVTHSISKQLLPVYDKPMIYYPLTTLMLADIKEILIITTPNEQFMFQELLDNGSQWGIDIHYEKQENPEGLAQAFIIGENFVGNDFSTLILGDNIFYGNDMNSLFSSASQRNDGATVFLYHVSDPGRYGVAEFDKNNQVKSLEEKPKFPKSSYAVTGLYFYDNKVVEYAKELKPSKRGELEITDLNKRYLKDNKLYIQSMDRGYAWLDTGTHESLLEAGQFISTIENRQGLKIACPEEVAYSKGWINALDLQKLAEPLMKNQYGQYLINLINNK
jgi:glucose-1-phosphate thymidylyltransferase